MHARALFAALGAVLAGTATDTTTRQYLGRGIGTRRNGQNKQPPKPQWLQDRLIARSAEKRERKASQRRMGRVD